jgi:hypothetical protein
MTQHRKVRRLSKLNGGSLTVRAALASVGHRSRHRPLAIRAALLVVGEAGEELPEPKAPEVEAVEESEPLAGDEHDTPDLEHKDVSPEQPADDHDEREES